MEVDSDFVYRISTAKEWEELQTNGSTFGGELDKSSAFIHLSKLNQNIYGGKTILYTIHSTGPLGCAPKELALHPHNDVDILLLELNKGLRSICEESRIAYGFQEPFMIHGFLWPGYYDLERSKVDGVHFITVKRPIAWWQRVPYDFYLRPTPLHH